MYNHFFCKRRVTLIMLLLCSVICLSACSKTNVKDYYSQKTNYIHATGIVNFISYNDEKTILYLGLSDLSPQFEDNCFKIVGENLMVVQEKNIDQKIQIGSQIDFITAPKYFGDGYVMPIVAISTDNEIFLEFDEGYDNLLKWLN